MLVLLEGRELVTRERDPEDNRARLVRLSSKGRRTFERLLKTSEPIREQMLKGFSAEAARSLIVGLRRVADNIAGESTLLPEAAHVVRSRRNEKTKLSL
jgi:DNA-binding MarR family transcriptional regulator